MSGATAQPDPAGQSERAATVAVLMDPGDDAALTHALLHRHDPSGGVVVVHPTPGVWAPAAFGHDLLAALGRAVNRLGEEHLTGAARTWQAAAAWMIADRITELVVLRADRLSPGSWERVLELTHTSGARLLLVCHTARIPAELLAVLGEYRVLTEPPHSVGPSAYPTPGRTDRPARRQVHAEDVDTRDVPVRGVAHYRAEAFRHLDPAAFAHLDAFYQRGFAAACAWLGTHPVPEESTAGAEGVQLFLVELVHDSVRRVDTVALLRGAQAAFLAHGLLLGVPATADLMNVLSGPGLNALPVTRDTAERIRAGVATPTVAAALAAALFTGITPRLLSGAALLGPSEAPDQMWVRWAPSSGWPPPARRNPVIRTAPAEPRTVVFHVPPAARPLLRAAAEFARARPVKARQRLLYPPPVTLERIAAAAANCGIVLPDHPGDLVAAWQLRITCRQLDAPPAHRAPTGGSRPAPSPPQTTEPDDGRYGRRPLTIETATALLHLIHDDRNAIPRYERPSTAIAGRNWRLVRRRLAFYARDPAGQVIALAPHPDVLFALRLTDRPAAPAAEDPSARHEDR